MHGAAKTTITAIVKKGVARFVIKFEQSSSSSFAATVSNREEHNSCQWPPRALPSTDYASCGVEQETRSMYTYRPVRNSLAGQHATFRVNRYRPSALKVRLRIVTDS